mmetsp:Transcript_20399/g.29509  ORF Transcript_20399/g.29509 Transcript_20399/m.29509 type:complete len:318 (+) Transcript_20399:147-1100(+)|eukprot:CAMPEP_0202452638 /NCGR_PEP_ID=MMETSP1360-20130828/10799_1 /ASSEMBLY_ACC=CAM_ASM_000848 /TAXON_ID=515479 /ORGANISM="Licmophora paradoxa, Strain CCMP2313" /LENGTH=317 /DNA_ID=CAMNT_0049071507 /DNA_START=102 /DNA_END=1052 /DNA_ORIENTATION=+
MEYEHNNHYSVEQSNIETGSHYHIHDEQRQQKSGYNPSPSSSSSSLDRFKALLWNERRLLASIGLLLLCLNIPWGRYILYPFMMFSIWTHEMCHGIAAILAGGTCKEIYLYPDGSGYCTYNLGGDRLYTLRQAFIGSAGYCGTAYTGAILLLFRKTRRGPKIGTLFLGGTILLSCLLWVRNRFGLLCMIPMGIVLLLCGLLIPTNTNTPVESTTSSSTRLDGAGVLGTIYTFLAAACCLNAMEYIHSNFRNSDIWDGRTENNATDAMDVAELLGGTYFMWMLIWYIQAIIMLLIGVVFALPGPQPSDGSGNDGILVI